MFCNTRYMYVVVHIISSLYFQLLLTNPSMLKSPILNCVHISLCGSPEFLSSKDPWTSNAALTLCFNALNDHSHQSQHSVIIQSIQMYVGKIMIDVKILIIASSHSVSVCSISDKDCKIFKLSPEVTWNCITIIANAEVVVFLFSTYYI